MIQSIVVTDRFKIGVNSKDGIKLGEHKMTTKEVPFFRYRFDTFVDSDIEYINSMKNKFNTSTHMAEVVVKDGFLNEIELLKKVDDLVIFLYINVTNDDADRGSFSEETKNLIEQIEDLEYEEDFERIMLKDNSSFLHTVSANKLKKEVIDIVGYNLKDIGICSSPLSFTDGNACLTALKAREIAGKYNEFDEGALPTKNHECMSCCGCIRYHLVEEDVKAPAEKSDKGTVTVKKEKVKKEGVEEEKKEVIKKKSSKPKMKADINAYLKQLKK